MTSLLTTILHKYNQRYLHTANNSSRFGTMVVLFLTRLYPQQHMSVTCCTWRLLLPPSLPPCRRSGLRWYLVPHEPYWWRRLLKRLSFESWRGSWTRLLYHNTFRFSIISRLHWIGAMLYPTTTVVRWKLVT